MHWRLQMPRIEHERVLAAIRAAEARTSGEIRVLVVRHKVVDPVAAAKVYFTHLGMEKSRLRNGVLIFLAPLSRNFAVVGDAGVHERCGDAFWAELAAAMGTRFRQRAFTDGLVHGIERAGELLAGAFPRPAEGGKAGKAVADEVD